MKQIFLLAGLLASATPGTADTTDVKQFRHIGPISLSTPLQTDTTDAHGKVFDVQSLLDGFIPAHLTDQSPINDKVILPASSRPAIHLAGFYATNQRFATGHIRIDGPKYHVLYIDGRRQDRPEYSLEPGTHRFVIKALADTQCDDTLRVVLTGTGGEELRPTTDTTRIYTLRDVMKGRRISHALLSADGKFLFIHYATTRLDGTTTTELRLCDLATGHMSACPAGAQWMPEGHCYYHLRPTTDGYELIATDAADGSERTLVGDLPNERYTLTPDASALLFYRSEEPQRGDADLTEILSPDDRQPGWRRRYNLNRLDRKTGAVSPLTFGHSLQPGIYLSDDGHYLFSLIRETRLTERPFYLTSVLRTDLRTMRTDTVVRWDGFVNGPIYSPDGNRLIIGGSPEAFGGIGLAVAEGQTASMYDMQLYLIDIEKDEVRPLTKDFDPSVESYMWCKGSNTIYIVGARYDTRRLYTVSPETGRIAEVPTGEEYIKSFSVDRDGRWLAYLGESASNGERLYLRRNKDGKTRLIEDTGRKRLQGIELGECHDYDFVNSRGDTIRGRFYLPPRFDASRSYPLIVNYYGGCTPTGRTFESRYPHHAYAALGYVVYVVQPSGASGFGQEFSARHVNAWGDYTADDIIEGTRRFCADHPYVNPKKIGCIGASYGGFTTQLLQTRTDLFAAAISHAGISNIASYWGEGYWGYSYSQVATAGNYPWNNPKLYTEHSPLFHADKIHTPLLFLHGTDDTNVPVGESIQMFTALKLLGRETAFVTVRGENHQILDFHKRQKWQNTIFAWFAKWLQDDPLWWDTLYPPKDL